VTDGITIEAAVAALWSAGVLLQKVRDHQMTVYSFLAGADGRDETMRLAYVHRQFGKSYLANLIGNEVARQKRNARVSIVAPTQKMLRSISLPNMNTLQEDCPESLRPQFSALDSVYTFSNGSTIRLDGADAGNMENLRGRANDLVIIDEAGFIKDLKALIHDIILPSFLTTGGRLILITTPPKTAGHYCAQLRARLALRGCFLKYRLSDNPSITPDQRKRWADEAGGADSPSYLREYECEEITDADAAVCPEFDSTARAALVAPQPAPDPFVKRVVGMDLGWGDPTGVLFGYYDFRKAVLRLQDELLLEKPLIGVIARDVRAKEQALWPGVPPYARISDIDPMVLAELASTHGLPFRPVSKATGKEQMVNELRTWVRQRRIFIDPRCINLIAQLEAAIWTGTRRSFEHTEAYGHFDLVDALVYLLQALPRGVNPYPLMPEGVNPFTHYIEPGAFVGPEHDVVKQMVFRPRGTWARR
jgi:hypothetical protein